MNVVKFRLGKASKFQPNFALIRSMHKQQDLLHKWEIYHGPKYTQKWDELDLSVILTIFPIQIVCFILFDCKVWVMFFFRNVTKKFQILLAIRRIWFVPSSCWCHTPCSIWPAIYSRSLGSVRRQLCRLSVALLSIASLV